MNKLPYEQLADMLNAARGRVVPGSKWQHYKGGEYTIDHMVLLEDTSEVAVIYAPVSHPDISFVRPLTSWLETVEWNGETMPRYVEIG